MPTEGSYPPFHLYSRKETILLLAGGKGTRMGEVSEKKQKCCVEISGETLIGHIIFELTKAFSGMNLLVAVSHLSEQVEHEVRRHLPKNSSAMFIPHASGADLIGIYESIQNILPLKRPFMRVSGDVLTTSQVFAGTWEGMENEQVDVQATANADVAQVDTHFLMKPSEKNSFLLGEYVKPNEVHQLTEYFRDMSIMAWKNPQLLYQLLEQLYPRDQRFGGSSFSLIRHLHSQERVGLNATSEPWVHVGYPEDLQKQWPPQLQGSK